MNLLRILTGEGVGDVLRMVADTLQFTDHVGEDNAGEGLAVSFHFSGSIYLFSKLTQAMLTAEGQNNIKGLLLPAEIVPEAEFNGIYTKSGGRICT